VLYFVKFYCVWSNILSVFFLPFLPPSLPLSLSLPHPPPRFNLPLDNLSAMAAATNVSIKVGLVVLTETILCELRLLTRSLITCELVVSTADVLRSREYSTERQCDLISRQTFIIYYISRTRSTKKIERKTEGQNRQNISKYTDNG